MGDCNSTFHWRFLVGNAAFHNNSRLQLWNLSGQCQLYGQFGYGLRRHRYRDDDGIRPERERFDEVRGSLPMPAEELLRSPGAFVDAHGILRVGQVASVALARAICEAHRDAVLKLSLIHI